ncbi:hypothetical protein [Cellulomonas palmilytica]|uniref:hypothetical protein n=1 Tax=Cellulomonas palmilytica TaxID=2608402 RepID=UPI001F208B17|nr:hypothetical protein [Cellulomonas palmilytica]UJP39691.1 hypothetical protein F1D97_15525 [Cellulomonas palmilytica]
MRRSSARVRALVVIPTVLVLGACSSGVSGGEADACNHVHAWSTGGQVPDEFEETVATSRDRLGEAQDGPVADALEALAATPDDAQAAGADAFLAVCADEGWDLPEG